MISKIPRMFVILLITLLLMVGCNTAKPEAAGEPITEIGTPQNQAVTSPTSYPVEESAYPVGEMEANTSTEGVSPYPDLVELEPYIFKTPVPGTATIHGILVVMDPDFVVPAPDDGIYLVNMPASDSVVSIPQFEPGSVPQADVDERTGEFIFTGIQPGQYAIVVLTTSGLQNPVKFYESGSLAIIEVAEKDIDQTMELEYLQIP